MHKLYKKGIAIDDLTPLLAIIIGFIFIALFLNINAVNKEIKIIANVGERLNQIKAQEELASILRTDIEIDGKMTSIGNLMSMYYTELETGGSNKAKYKKALDSAIIDRLNNLEYCYQNPRDTRIKFVRGFMIFLTDNPAEGLTGAPADRRFISNHHKGGIKELMIIQPYPLANGEIMYILWAEFGWGGGKMETICGKL